MRLIFFIMLLLSSLQAEETPWSGKWDMYWKDGSITMELTQTGNSISGHYYPYEGNLTATVKKNTLRGHFVQKNSRGAIQLTLSPDQNSFFGTLIDTEWINGYRITEQKRSKVTPYDLSSPYHALSSFLRLSNSVRSGKHENLGHAIACLEMDEATKALPFHQKFLLASILFDVIDEHTIILRTVAQKAEGNTYFYNLRDHRTDTVYTLEFVKDIHQKWRMKLPPKKQLQQKLSTLLNSRGKDEVNPNEHLKLETPRSTIRTFIEQVKKWDSGGKEHVISTLNLSWIDPKIREWQAPILAQYLKQVLDRISLIIYQEIPNNPKSELAYVHFHHPLGKIIIAPFEAEGKTRWQFTPETLASIAVLDEAMENLPLKKGISTLENTTYFFALRHQAKKLSNLLVYKVFYLELWQWIAIVVILLVSFMLAQLFSFLTLKLLHKGRFTNTLNREGMVLRYLRPMKILTVGLIWTSSLIYIGIPDFIFSILSVFGLLLIAISTAWLSYNIINLVMEMLHHRTNQTETDIDDILVSLIGSTLKIIVVIASFFAAAEILSVPYQTVIAGLGIGGLAFAIAAKDTIANFFGSAIILADRPFVQGDEVKIGSYFGTVTHVGIRSTRLRTLDDTEVIIPNNQISSDIVDNFSKRDYRRIKSHYTLSNKTDKATLDKLDFAIIDFLEKDPNVINIDILTGIQEYSMVGIEFNTTFYVDAQSKVEYTAQRHRLLGEIARIIHEHGIELVSVRDNLMN